MQIAQPQQLIVQLLVQPAAEQSEAEASSRSQLHVADAMTGPSEPSEAALQPAISVQILVQPSEQAMLEAAGTQTMPPALQQTAHAAAGPSEPMQPLDEQDSLPADALVSQALHELQQFPWQLPAPLLAQQQPPALRQASPPAQPVAQPLVADAAAEQTEDLATASQQDELPLPADSLVSEALQELLHAGPQHGLVQPPQPAAGLASRYVAQALVCCCTSIVLDAQAVYLPGEHLDIEPAVLRRAGVTEAPGAVQHPASSTRAAFVAEAPVSQPAKVLLPPSAQPMATMPQQVSLGRLGLSLCNL